MIMAKRVWAHKMATCGAKRDRGSERERQGDGVNWVHQSTKHSVAP